MIGVLVARLPNGHLRHSVYRKPTHTDRYLNANSQHHPAQNQSVISFLVHRAIRISQPDNIKKELKHVKTAQMNIAAETYSRG